jgi:hypothetical protein
MSRVAYFLRGGGESWAVIRLTGRDREEVVVDGLAKEVAIERCYALLEDLRRGAAATGELPADTDIVSQRRSRQLSLKF